MLACVVQTLHCSGALGVNVFVWPEYHQHQCFNIASIYLVNCAHWESIERRRRSKTTATTTTENTNNIVPPTHWSLAGSPASRMPINIRYRIHEQHQPFAHCICSSSISHRIIPSSEHSPMYWHWTRIPISNSLSSVCHCTHVCFNSLHRPHRCVECFAHLIFLNTFSSFLYAIEFCMNATLNVAFTKLIDSRSTICSSV